MSRLAWFIILTNFCAACSSSQEGPLYDFCQGSTEVTMDYDKWLLPFPSDYFLIEDSSTPSGYRINLTDQTMPASENMFEAFPFMSEQLSALDGFGDHRSNGFRVDVGQKEIMKRFCITKRNTVNLRGKRAKPEFEGLDLSSHGHGQICPAMVSIVENDDGLSLGGIAGYLYGIFHGLGTAVQKNRFFREIPGRQLTQLFGQRDRRLVRVHHETTMGEPLCLFFDGGHYLGMAVANIHGAEPPAEIDVFPAIYINELCACSRFDKIQ